MSLVPAKCPNCGGNIKIERENKAGICEFCKQPFVVEDAINNYNTYNQNTYNIENAEIYINEKNEEQRIESAEIFLTKIGNKEEAKKIFAEVSQTSPGNYKAWWGLARIDTNEFDFDERNLDNYKDVKQYVENAISVANHDVSEEMKIKWRTFVTELIEYKEKLNSKLGELQEKLNNLEHIINPLKTNISVKESEINDLLLKRDKLQKEIAEKQNVSIAKNIIVVSIVAFVIWFVIGGIIKVSTFGTDETIDKLLYYIIIPVFILGIIMQIVMSYNNHLKEKKINLCNLEVNKFRQNNMEMQAELEINRKEYEKIHNKVSELNRKIYDIDSIVK